jgi:hypothetical protein
MSTKPYVSFVSAKVGRPGRADVIGPDEKVIKSFTKETHGFDYKLKAVNHFKAMADKMTKSVDEAEQYPDGSDGKEWHAVDPKKKVARHHLKHLMMLARKKFIEKKKADLKAPVKEGYDGGEAMAEVIRRVKASKGDGLRGVDPVALARAGYEKDRAEKRKADAAARKAKRSVKEETISEVRYGHDSAGRTFEIPDPDDKPRRSNVDPVHTWKKRFEAMKAKQGDEPPRRDRAEMVASWKKKYMSKKTTDREGSDS